MRRREYWRVLAALAVLLACTTSTLGAARGFKANLSGRNEVPAVDTQARGHIKLKVSKDGTTISYRLIVANIENVTAAHLHLGVVGMNGGVIVTLFGGPTTDGAVNGILAEGTITAADLSGPLEGLELDALIDAIADGDVYVNVHTTEHTGGEIRGQVR